VVPRLEAWLTWLPIRSYLTNLFDTNDYDFILAHNPIPAGYMGLKLANQSETTLVVVFHSYADLDTSASNDRLRTIFTEVASSADVVVTVSEMMKDKLEPIYSGDITIIRNGFDPEEVNATQSTAVSSRIDLDDRKLILSVGSLTERKGHIYLLKAINNLVSEGVFEQDGYICLLVGSGPKERHLKEYVNQHDLDDYVEFQSGLTRNEVNSLMKSADVFVLPSWNEPCATVFSETMAYGTPMILVRDEGFSELITNRETGMLVPPRDAQSLSVPLREVLTNSELSERIERQSLMVAHSNLKWDQNAATLLETIEQSATSSQ
jgi:glycosyltransferase involved in cell wall biosynthesis